MKPKKFYLEIYNTTYLFFIGNPRQKVDQYLQKNLAIRENMPEGAGVSVYSQSKSGEDIISIFVEEKNDIITLAHECLHAAMWTLGSVGINPTPEEHESLTYLFDAIYKEGLKYLKK